MIGFLCGLFYGWLLCGAWRKRAERERLGRLMDKMQNVSISRWTGNYSTDLPGYLHPSNWGTPCTCDTDGDRCIATFHMDKKCGCSYGKPLDSWPDQSATVYPDA